MWRNLRDPSDIRKKLQHLVIQGNHLLHLNTLDSEIFKDDIEEGLKNR